MAVPHHHFILKHIINIKLFKVSSPHRPSGTLCWQERFQDHKQGSFFSFLKGEFFSLQRNQIQALFWKTLRGNPFPPGKTWDLTLAMSRTRKETQSVPRKGILLHFKSNKIHYHVKQKRGAHMIGTGWGTFLLGAKSLCRIHPSGSMGNFLNSGSRIPFRFQALPQSREMWHLSVLALLSLFSPLIVLVHSHHTSSSHKTWGPVALQILGIKFSLRTATNQ